MSLYATQIDFLLSENEAAALGTVEVYAAGTSSPLISIYSDRLKTTLDNPVTLDSRGTASIFADGVIKIVVKNAAGATLYTRDNLSYGIESAYWHDCDAYPGGISEAIQSIGTTNATLVIKTDTAMTASRIVPSTLALDIRNGAKITTTGYTLTIESGFTMPRAQIFTGTGSVVFSDGAVSEVYPEWWGAVPDGTTDGSGTDSTTALQAAIDVPVIPVRLTGNYIFSNLTIPDEKVINGGGIHNTALIAKTGSTGIAITDTGSAAKITLRDFAVYGRNLAGYTGALKLGYNGTQFGTEALFDNIWVRDFVAGFPGIDINGNVGHFGRILAQETGGVQIIGVSNMVDKCQSYGSKGFTPYGETGLTVCTNLQLTHIDCLEIEAPYENTIPLYLSRSASVNACTISLAANETASDDFSHLVEVGISATTWEISNLLYAFGSATYGPVIANGNIKLTIGGSAYYTGGNATGKSASGNGSYTSDKMGMQIQSFTLRIAKTSGNVIQHRISSSSGNVSNFCGKITGASVTLTDTPTGTDASTAFDAGAKIGSASASVIFLNTNNQHVRNFAGMATIVFNNTGTGYNIIPYVTSLDINGVTRTRLCFQLTNATTGASVAWATALSASQTIDIQFYGLLA